MRPARRAVIVPRDRAAGLSPTVRKVASGAAETVPLIQVVNLARTLRWLKEREIWVVGTDDQAPKSLYETKLTGPLALVLGAEGAGTAPADPGELRRCWSAIPMAGCRGKPERVGGDRRRAVRGRAAAEQSSG